jgi:hypothetical protein
MIKKIALCLFVTISLSGCAGSIAGLATFSASDLSYDEYQFHRNITAGYRVLNTCNEEYSYGYNLAPMRVRIQMDSEQNVMWEDIISSSYASKSDCIFWEKACSKWSEEGVMPLRGGSIEDPKWTEYTLLQEEALLNKSVN